MSDLDTAVEAASKLEDLIKSFGEIDTLTLAFDPIDPPIELEWAGADTTMVPTARHGEPDFFTKETSSSGVGDIADGAELYDEIRDLACDWPRLTIRLTIDYRQLGQVVADAYRRAAE